MKLLILVQACNDTPFKEVNDCQMETWDSEIVKDVKTIYYLGNNNNGGGFIENGGRLLCPCSEEYNMMHWRMKLACDYVWDMDWDVMFRTNSSTYVRKDRIKDYVDRMDKKVGVYSGVVSGGMVSGTGILMTRDVVEIIKDNMDNYPTDSEDCAIGTLLGKHGISKIPILHYFAFASVIISV